MNLKPILIANSTLLAVMFGTTAWFWNKVPDGARVPMHWNLEGAVDRYGSKYEALLLFPATAVFITLLMLVLPFIDPRRANLESSAKLWNAIAISLVALFAYLHFFLARAATGQIFDIADYLIPAVSVFYLILGNYLSKTRSNWFAGVRTPWTMSSDYSWEKTHRWAGRLFVLSGIASIAAWLTAGVKVAAIVMLLTLLGTAVLSIVLSYVFWKNDPSRVSGAPDGESA